MSVLWVHEYVEEVLKLCWRPVSCHGSVSSLSEVVKKLPRYVKYAVRNVS